ncbi:MAG: YlxR family protein [Candidatus Izemoplasma sp.]|nr:YlxR family protein [Candidatus Izemoplasma sp.]
MKKNRKVPLRTCVITQERLPKQHLLRVVKTKDGNIFVDETQKANGRGAYVKRDVSVIKKAQKNKRLNKHLNTEVPDEIYETLLNMVD